MHKSKLRQITIAACIALMPLIAEAAGLGRLHVISGLGEPLNAEIELLSTTPEELSTLTAAVASEAAYATQGIEFTSVHRTIKIEPGTRADGTPVLKLTTGQAIEDPFLDVLIQVDWPTGRLLREYTALLDPPGYSANAADVSAPVPMPAAQLSEPMEVMPSPQEKQAAMKTMEDSMTAPDAVSMDVPTDEHETKKGDTLSAIAKRMQVDGVSLDQMLVGLYRANPDAFVGENMNRLKVGQIIRAPSAEELEAVSRQDATSEVKVQAADWNAYRSKLAGMVEEAPAASEDAGNQSTGGKLAAAAEDKATPTSDGPRDVVKLSKSDDGGSSSNKADAKAMQDKLNALQEESTAREKSVKEANERVAALENQITDMQKLLAVKSQAMADLQKNAAPAKPGAPANDVAVKPTPPAMPAPAEKPATTAVQAPTPAPAAETPAKPEAATDVKASAVEGSAPVKPSAKKKMKKIVVPPPAPVEEPGMLDGLLAGDFGDNGVLLGGVGGGVLLLGGAWLFFRSRRKHDLESFEQGILTSGGLKANTVFGNTSGDTVDTGDTSFLTDFSQSPGGMIDTHDVDAIAEAEVYMAYGREAQAEEILKDAIAKEPTRYELHLKLLEIFATRNDSSAFEAVSGELYSTLGASSPVWAKVAEMGHKMEPDNPLYDVSSLPAASDAAVVPAAVEGSQKLDVSDFDSAEVMTESSLDFSLDADTVDPVSVTPEVESKPEESSSLDFDLAGGATLPMEEMSAESGAPESASLSMDMSMDADAPLDFPDQALETQPIESLNMDTESTVQMEAPEFGATLPGVELGGLDMPELGSEPSAPAIDISATPDVTEETKSAEDGGLDFNFNLGAAEIAQPAEISSESEASPPVDNVATEVDLSGISLELDTPSGVTVEENVPTASAGAAIEGESEDVNTKLDLVTAYIDMGDKEGAKELLDEVIKEGGVKQRERAQQMLSSLA